MTIHQVDTIPNQIHKKSYKSVIIKTLNRFVQKSDFQLHELQVLLYF